MTTTSCSTSLTSTSTGTGSFSFPNLAPLLAAYSTLGVHFGSSNSSFTSTYNVVYASSTTYKVAVSSNISEGAQPLTAWVLKNGTVLAASFAGQNLTGAQANGIFEGYMSAFVLELQFNSYLGAFTSAAGVHQSGTGTTTITGTTLSVTNYAASSLPLTLSACGNSFVLTAFSLQTASVPGSSLTLITLFHITGTSTYNGKQSNEDFTISVVSITKA